MIRVTLGGSSLLLGATHMAPSKDTLWTASPQPSTSSDRTNSGYKTQPHVALDAILATLSLGTRHEPLNSNPMGGSSMLPAHLRAYAPRRIACSAYLWHPGRSRRHAHLREHGAYV